MHGRDGVEPFWGLAKAGRLPAGAGQKARSSPSANSRYNTENVFKNIRIIALTFEERNK